MRGPLGSDGCSRHVTEVLFDLQSSPAAFFTQDLEHPCWIFMHLARSRTSISAPDLYIARTRKWTIEVLHKLCNLLYNTVKPL